MRAVGWRLWYLDGSVYESREYAWEDLPDDGILVRMIYYTEGRQIQQGMEYYYEAPHHSGEPIRGTGNRMDEIIHRYPGAVIKSGQWAPDEYYRQVVDAAMASRWGE